jgi:hypothetical protein
MEFKGTKGKWVLKVFPEGQMSVRNENDTRKICVPRVQNYYESLANLLLISKAPEMLEMLEKVLIHVDWSYETWTSNHGLIIEEEIKKLIKEATKI